MQVYTDEDVGSARKTNQGTRFVRDLVENIKKSGQNIIYDNFFTKLLLAQKLFLKELTLVETIKKNKTELSMEFTRAKGRNVRAQSSAFNKMQ